MVNSKKRGDYRFVCKVPDSMPSEVCASFLCAGLTCFSPLRRTGVDSTSVVGIMGLGKLFGMPLWMVAYSSLL